MCLDSLSDSYVNKPDTPFIQSGWKVFEGSGKNMRFAAQSTTKLEFDKWLTAKGPEIRCGYGAHYNYKSYPAGFHIYADEKQKSFKERWYRVYYRKVTSKGYQDGCTVVIAEELYIPSDEEAWPPKG